MPRTATYRVLIKDYGTSFRPGSTLLDLENAKHVGFSEYINDVGECFFTINQDDPKAAEMGALVNKEAHVLIYRNADLVFAGWLGETDETGADVIFYGYSYLAGLFWLHTDWNRKWAGEQISQIVSDSWGRAKLTWPDTRMVWMTTGTIEAPVTTSGGATPIVLPHYSTNYKRILFLMQELAGMAVGDTTNRVIFEITPDGTFNFWKNRGTTQTGRRLEYGGNVLDYRRIRTPMDNRNVILGVGSTPHDIIKLQTDENAADKLIRGRKEEPIYYSWVRDEDEIERVNKLRLSRALRIDNQLMLSMAPNSLVPARATGADFAIADYIPVLIQNGATSINSNRLITGQQVVYSRGVERVRLILQDTL